MSFNPYDDKPIEQQGLKRCCTCTWDVSRHVKQRVTGKYLTEFIDKELYWCKRCGLELSLHDIDMLEAKARGEIL